MGFDLGGNHPLHPLRWELTWLPAQTLGVIDDFDILVPEPADVDTLSLVHTLGYIDAVRRASSVQAAFYDDPRVLTVSIHQSPLTLFRHRVVSECGSGPAWGTSVNLPVPASTGDASWLRAFHAVVPAVVRAFGPEVLVTQHGADTTGRIRWPI